MSEDLAKQGPRPRPKSSGRKKTTKTLLKSDSKESCFNVPIIMWIILKKNVLENKIKKTDEKYIWDESTLVIASKSWTGLLFVLLSGF